MVNFYYSFIGHICKALDESGLNYHHCRTWFKLFLEDDIYSITSEEEIIKSIEDAKIVVYKGDHISWCRNSNALPVFHGTLQEFINWLKQW